MYGLPKNFDGAIFTGEELQQVCIGRNDLILKFHPPASILITSSVAFISEHGERYAFEGLADAGRFLVGLLGQTVKSAQPAGRRVLRLEFSAGTLELLDDSERFESFVIKRGQQEIVV